MRLIVFVACACILSAGTVDTSPGKLNHVTGAVSLNQSKLPEGRGLQQTIHSTDVLESRIGRVEVLLSPGIFLRIGNRSRVIFAGLRPETAQIRVESGQILLDVAEQTSRLEFSMGGITISPVQPGLYELDTSPCSLKVYHGAAEVLAERHTEIVRKNKMASCTASVAQSFNFDKADALYAWSAEVAEYEAAASYGAARHFQRNRRRPVWDWDEIMHCWAFVPASGIVSGPFGWAFASGGQLADAYLLMGSHSRRFAAADAHNLPRQLPLIAEGQTLDLARAARVRRPDLVGPVNSGPSIWSPDLPNSK